MSNDKIKPHNETQDGINTFDTGAQTDLNQMQNDQNAFLKDAPDNLEFDLPFGLGKLFGLPGEKQKEQQEQDAQKSQQEADAQAAQGPNAGKESS